MRSNKIEENKTEIRRFTTHFSFFLSLTHQPLYMCSAKTANHFFINNNTFFSFSFIWCTQENKTTETKASEHILCFVRFHSFVFIISFFFVCAVHFDSFVLLSSLLLVWLRRVGIQFKIKKNKMFSWPARLFSIMVFSVYVSFARCGCYFSCVIWCAL